MWWCGGVVAGAEPQPSLALPETANRSKPGGLMTVELLLLPQEKSLPNEEEENNITDRKSVV